MSNPKSGHSGHAQNANWFPMHEMQEVVGIDANHIDRNRITTLLLDMGGVVVSLHPDRVFKYWSQASGVDMQEFVPKWSIEQCYEDYETGMTSFGDLARGLERQLGIAMDFEDWRRGWNALVGEAIPEVFELVEELAARFPVYCFTNSNPEHESIWASRLKRELQVFVEIFNSSSIGLRKPDVRAFEDVAVRMNCDPGQVLFLDDNRRNVQGAIESGMQAAHVATRIATARILKALLETPDQPPFPSKS